MPDNPFDFEPPLPIPDDYFERFVNELEAIRIAVQQTNALIPEAASKFHKELADFYKTGHSEQASRSGGWKEQPGGAQVFMGPSPGASIDEDTRQMAGEEARRTGVAPRTYDPDVANQESGGYHTGPSSGASRGSVFNRMKNWEDEITPEHLQRGVFEIPRSEGGHFTAQDALNYAADSLKASAAKSQQRYGDDSTRAQIKGQVGTALGWAGEQAPKLALYKQYLSKVGVMADPSSLEAQGAQLGVSPNKGFGSNINLGPIGLRVPYLNPAARAAEKREWEIAKERMQAGINGKQARFIFDELNARGFKSQSDQHGRGSGGMKFGEQYGQDPRMRPTPNFDRMKDAANWMTKNHPELVNQQYFDLMDKATRSGGASLKAFNQNMAEVSSVAKETGYSFQQLQADMDAMGGVNEQQGGTHFGGQVAAKDYQALTKTPAALLPGLAQNPNYQTYAVQHMGLMPWEQGLMTGPQRAAAATGGVTQMWNSLGPMPSVKQNLGGGFQRTVGSDDRRAAMVHQMYPELPVDKIKQMVHENKTVQTRAATIDRAQAWSTAVGAAARSGKKGVVAHLMNQHGGPGTWQELNHEMVQEGLTPKERSSVYKAGKKDGDKEMDPATAATKRYKKLREITESKGNKLSGNTDPNTVTIKFDSKARKKGFYFDNKDKGGAGQVNVNMPYGSGPSPSPSDGDVYNSFQP